ncbi:hypothetical protein B0J13DRAFT_640788 [Dactylonectria estremocensis]|uniref:Uncharacterized protein n=1 Tax=Dactylonectria estremocensis TaxID=1079267 RepID=A0A9P9EH90_9HYPO|nr:hypothetical protein B0J13DRAFT_640788 [Dactylonectria estremocensis]
MESTSSDQYYNLGHYQHKVATTSSEAQTWFDRGLLWAFSFNHEEALRCFQRAIKHDPECAMAYWGVAYAIGPNYNKAWIRYDKDDRDNTVKEATNTLALGQKAQNIRPVERALIEALSNRFLSAAEVPGDLGSLDRAYAAAMRLVYKEFGDDADVAILFVEALMCIRPRGLWDLTTGKPTGPITLEALDILETRLAQAGRDHPAFCHLYIHMVEMAPFPEKAVPAADRLRRLVPDGSHMQHMATHIDVACGDWRRAIESNRDAMISDDIYFAREKSSVLYTVYRSHNMHVLVYAAMMAGRFQDALSVAKRMPDILPPEFLSIKSPPMVNWAEFQVGLIVHVLIRFGRWEDLLELGIPQDQQLFSITTAMIRYGRGIALAVLGRIKEADVARAEFETARRGVPADRTWGIACAAETVLKVASRMLEGELEYRKANYEKAFALLREGVELEDDLPYADPPVWMQPVRHALGALSLEQGQVKEAMKLYEQDLGLSDELPRRKARINNVWALSGLYECYTLLGRHGEARKIRFQHDIAVAAADVAVGVSCFCRLSAVKKISCCGLEGCSDKAG